ncbi:heavy-metal-associated domain-containing protein [Microbacterium sp. YY-01]|uniref:heavy-metal-associated domain-containing protein n=1 Tax=Microbacterium sp. YY-01 TaxID=3421634 RepID=UPI003D168903
MLQINGMTCSHCERALAAELGRAPGVLDAEIDAITGRVAVRVGGFVERSVLATAVAEAGYELESGDDDH